MGKTKTSSTSNICRACSGNCGAGGFSLTKSSIQDLYEKCTEIKIKLDTEDKLPMALCRVCMDMCETWEQFKTSCRLNEIRIQQSQAIPELIPVDDVSLSKRAPLSLKKVIKIKLNEESLQTINDKKTIEGNRKSGKELHSGASTKPPLSEDLEKEISIGDLLSGLDKPPFKCTRCPSKFSIRHNLLSHMCRKHGYRPLAVDISEQKAHPESSISRTDAISFNCYYCDQSFRTSNGRLKHLRKAHKSSTATEPLPPEYPGDDIAIASPSRMEGKKFQCSDCPKILRNSESLIRHMNKSHGQKPLPVPSTLKNQCSHCLLIFPHKSQLEAHLTKIHDIPATVLDKLLCEKCGASFWLKSVLKIHLATHSSARPYECKTCGLKMKHKMNMAKHVKRHLNDRKFKCDGCDRSFLTNIDLRNHKHRRHDEERVKEECRICGSKVYEMQKHIMRLHSGDLCFKHFCDICGRGFKAPNPLMYHRHTHTGEKNHLCTICGQHFRKPWTLKMHMKTHNKD